MSTRCLIIACVLLILSIPAQAQWVQTNVPRHDVLKFGGNVSSLASLGTDLFAGEDGVLLSMDSGTTWTAVGMTHSGGRTLLASGGNLYAGASSTVFFSTDSGANWTTFPFAFPNFNGISAIAVSGGNIIVGTGGDSTFLSTDSGKSWKGSDSIFNVSCFATIGGNLFAGEKNGIIFISTDEGVVWKRTTVGPERVFSLAAIGSYLFAGAGNGVFFSIDGGTSWNAMNNGLPSSSVDAFATSGQNLFAGTEGDGVFLSTYNGLSWSNWTAAADNGLTNPNINTLLADSGNLYAGTAGSGVFHSTDNGASWIVHNPLSTVNTNINNLDTSNDKIFACTPLGLYATVDSGSNWTLDSNGMGSISVSAVVGADENLYAGTSFNGVFLSTNDGTNWTAARDSGLSDVNTLVQNVDTLYAGSSGGIFLSTNRGATWSNPDPEVGNVLCLTLEGSNVFAGTQGNLPFWPIYYSTDRGIDWNIPINSPPPTTTNALAIIDEYIYAGTSDYGVWLSTDSGMDWIEVSSGLTDTNITTLLVNGTHLFAGTNSGRVFHSSDSGASWRAIDSGLNVSSEITSLTVKDSNIYAGTPDSGIWRHSLLKTVPKSAVIQTYSTQEVFHNHTVTLIAFPDPSSDYVNVNIPSSDGTQEIHVYDEIGREIYPPSELNGSQLTLDVSSLPAGTYYVSGGHTEVKFVKK